MGWRSKLKSSVIYHYSLLILQERLEVVDLAQVVLVGQAQVSMAYSKALEVEPELLAQRGCFLELAVQADWVLEQEGR